MRFVDTRLILSGRWPALALAIIMMAAALFASVPAHAENSIRLNAVSYAPGPKDTAIEVVAMDDTNFNLDIAGWLSEALENAGKTLRSGAGLELSFETLTVVSQRRAGDIGEIKVDSYGESHLKLNMWATRGDSLLGARTRSSAAGHTALLLVLYDHASRTRLWEGELIAPPSVARNNAKLRWICGLIAERLGETVRRQTLTVN